MTVTLALMVVAFGAGVFLGIIDCKHTFGIPQRASIEDGEWLTHDTLNKIYGYNRNRNTVSTEQ